MKVPSTLLLVALPLVRSFSLNTITSSLGNAKPSLALNVATDGELEPVTAKERTSQSAKSSKVAVLLCPAQFCVPVDYEVLFENLKKVERADGPQIATCKVAPLPRTEWIKVAKSLPTKAYLEGNLPVDKTLSWYFDAIENALSEIFAEEGPDVSICLIGHSIGGWVARAYLGGLSR
jgi:hypothetical protein